MPSARGTATRPWQGQSNSDGVAVQGNILTGPEVLQAALSSFMDNGSVSLAGRLLVALEAGDPQDSPHVLFIVPGQRPGGVSPARVLRVRFDTIKAVKNFRGRLTCRCSRPGPTGFALRAWPLNPASGGQISRT